MIHGYRALALLLILGASCVMADTVGDDTTEVRNTVVVADSGTDLARADRGEGEQGGDLMTWLKEVWSSAITKAVVTLLAAAMAWMFRKTIGRGVSAVFTKWRSQGTKTLEQEKTVVEDTASYCRKIIGKVEGRTGEETEWMQKVLKRLVLDDMDEESVRQIYLKSEKQQRAFFMACRQFVHACRRSAPRFSAVAEELEQWATSAESLMNKHLKGRL